MSDIEVQVTTLEDRQEAILRKLHALKKEVESIEQNTVCNVNKQDVHTKTGLTTARNLVSLAVSYL